MPANNRPYEQAVILAEGARQVAVTQARLAYEANVNTEPANWRTYDQAIKAAEKAYWQAVASAADANGEPLAAADSRNRLDGLARRG